MRGLTIDRLSKYKGISGAELIENLLKKEEDLILGQLLRSNEPLDSYMQK